MEYANGFWATQLEFPGGWGTQKIDVITFDAPSPALQGPQTTYAGTSNGYVYEIEPATVETIIEGAAELAWKYAAIAGNIGDFTQVGNLPLIDYWDRPSTRSLSYMGTDYAGYPYDWTTTAWGLSRALSPMYGPGPVRVDPTMFGSLAPGGNIWWIQLVAPGFILYETEDELLRQLTSVTVLTAEIVAKYFLDKYREAQQNPHGASLPDPIPIPGVAYASVPNSTPRSSYWQWAHVCNTGLCMTPSDSARLSAELLELLGLLALAGLILVAA